MGRDCLGEDDIVAGRAVKNYSWVVMVWQERTSQERLMSRSNKKKSEMRSGRGR